MERIKQLLQSDQPLKWLFYGDSITHGALHTFGWRDYTEHFTERVRFEMNRRRDIVIKTAFSGNSTKDLLDYWMSNAFHPNQFGHQVFAELLFKELGIFDPKAATCRFFRP